MSDEPTLYRVTFKAAGRERITTAAGTFDTAKLQMDVDLGLFNLAKVLMPPTFLWFTAETPQIWVRSESLEAGLGSPKVLRELQSKSSR